MQQLSTPQVELNKAIATVKERISKAYLERFPYTHNVLAVADTSSTKIRVLRIARLVYSNERISDRLVSVYQTISGLVDSCFLIIQGNRLSADLYVGLRSTAASAAVDALQNSLLGNFPGISLELLSDGAYQALMKKIPDNNYPYAPNSVAMISVVPANRSENEHTDEENVQGLEKFIDSMQGKEYTAVILAKPYKTDDIAARISALEAVATGLTAMEQLTIQRSSSDSVAASETSAKMISDTINLSLSYGYSSAYTNTSFQQTAFSKGKSFNPFLFGFSSGTQSGYGSSDGTTQGINENVQRGQAFQNSVTQSTGLVLTNTVGESVTQTRRNVSVTNLLAQITQQIKRLHEGQAYGLWDCCGYFIANSSDIAITAASQFKSIVTGTDTYVEQSVLSLWEPTTYADKSTNYNNISNLIRSLKAGVPPQFIPHDSTNIAYSTDSVVTGAELPFLLGLPRHSTGSVTVLQMARFGRSVHHLDPSSTSREDTIRIGNVRHMGVEQLDPVYIQTSHLSGHTAIFGATGSGKSTAVCNILEALHDRGIPFTVIEPAKGDYGNIWRNLPGVQLFSTSPFKCRMLRLNPFAFQEETHILNHIERLIDVFRVCWPLYAAQAAVLRDCVYRAYVACGWDLVNSLYLGDGIARFPTFSNVLNVLPTVIKESKFVGEAKGTYEGALKTRLTMLTEGLFGQLLNNERDIPAEELFDHNAIIDLSELGSPEVLSLMIGVLLIRLHEHRMITGASELRHVTVLEEAHNILPRSTPNLNSEEGGNVVAKSVEVLTKCIAELRFTGEGFVIVDQSPNAVDISAIKNTAIKIMMRLNAQEDQQAAGAAMSLTESQENEISRFPRGVAAVYQDGWAEPVLAKLQPYQKKWSNETSLKVSATNICRIRSFLTQHILPQIAQKKYLLADYISALDRISGLDDWKKKDYLALFEYYEKRKTQLANSFELAAVYAPFFGELLRDILECYGLFKTYPIPAPDKSMAAPYAQDSKYIALCRRWEQKVLNALCKYCCNLSVDQYKKVLHMLLFAESPSNPICFLTIGALYSHHETKGD